MKQIFFLFYLFTSVILGQSNLSKISEPLQKRISNNKNDNILVWVYFSDKGKNIESRILNSRDLIDAKLFNRRKKVSDSDNLFDFLDISIDDTYTLKIEDYGVKIKQRSKWLNAVSFFGTKEQISKIEKLNFVKKITEVRKYKRKTNFKNLTPNMVNKTNVAFSTEAHNFNYGSSLTQNELINVAAVHDSGYTGKGIIICVMDAGFDQLSHEVFNTINIVDAWDFVNNDSDVENGIDAGEGSHGTATLSLIGGFKEGKLIGTAFGADYLLAKTENTDSETPLEEDNWIAAAEWAENLGADVFSTSLGYLDFNNAADNYTYDDMDGNTAAITIAADIAVKKGVVVFNSAGNNGSNSSHNTLSAPADGDSVFAIGAVASDGTRVSFSSVGPTADGRIKPDFMAMGSGTYAAGNSSDTHYKSFSGTSAACPLAAGVAALLLEKDYSLTPMEIREILRATSNNSLNPNKFYGWGIIDALAAIEEILEVQVELTILLEGAYDSGLNVMKTNITTSIPKQSPYIENARRVDEIPNDIVDWVLVELRTTVNGAAVASYSALLHKDGRIVADDGATSTIRISADPGLYYIVVNHRNHLPIISSAPLNLTTN